MSTNNPSRKLSVLRLVSLLELAAPGMVTYRMITAALGQQQNTIKSYASYARLLGYDVRAVRHYGLRINKGCMPPERKLRKKPGSPKVSPAKFREETPIMAGGSAPPTMNIPEDYEKATSG